MRHMIDLEGSSERTAIINVQGDQPFLDPSAIDEMVLNSTAAVSSLSGDTCV